MVGDVDEPINGYPGVIVNAPRFDDEDALDAFESRNKNSSTDLNNSTI